MNATAEMLRQRSFEFAVRVVKLARFLSQEKQDWVLARQVLRSGTSIGANVAESTNAQSDADFVNKLSVALKEANETEYWLKCLFAAGYIDERGFESMKADNDELIKMLVCSIKTKKANMTK